MKGIPSTTVRLSLFSSQSFNSFLFSLFRFRKIHNSWEPSVNPRRYEKEKFAICFMFSRKQKIKLNNACEQSKIYCLYFEKFVSYCFPRRCWKHPFTTFRRIFSFIRRRICMKMDFMARDIDGFFFHIVIAVTKKRRRFLHQKPFHGSRAATTIDLVEFEICSVKVIERDHFCVTIASHHWNFNGKNKTSLGLRAAKSTRGNSPPEKEYRHISPTFPRILPT